VNLVLQFSVLPGDISRKCDLKYIPESKTLIIDHPLPNPENLVYVKEFEFVKASGKFFKKRLSLSDGEFKSFYDDLLYQICLRTLYEFFVADKGNALSAVVFNGWVEFVDKATGQDRKGCLLSIQVTKEEFQKLNLTRVEPKACFKALKGIANSALHSFTPVEPVLKINREEMKKVVGKI
jgi:restriction system protein